MADHDQRLKLLLQEFFPDFLRLFFPDLAERFDLTAVQWLPQELFLDPPQGERRALDLVAQVPTRQAVAGSRPAEPEQWLALIHVEIDAADPVAPLRPRMFEYYWGLRKKYGRPVLPLAVYLQVGLEGLGLDGYDEAVWEFPVLQFRYWYIGLPALDGEAYAAGDNWLGVALSVLMRVARERRVELAARALERLVACPESPYRRYLLCECVQAYGPLTPEQRLELDQILFTERYTGVRAMMQTWSEQAVTQARRELLLTQLEERFGSLSAQARERLESWPAERLVELGRALVKAQTLQQLGLEE